MSKDKEKTGGFDFSKVFEAAFGIEGESNDDGKKGGDQGDVAKFLADPLGSINGLLEQFGAKIKAEAKEEAKAEMLAALKEEAEKRKAAK